MSMRVKFWGIRSGIPVGPSPLEIKELFQNLIAKFDSLPDGEKTRPEGFINETNSIAHAMLSSASSCIELQTESERLIINCGSGLRALSDNLLATQAKSAKKISHILVTVANYENLIGLPFFRPIFSPHQEVHFYTADPLFIKALRFQFKKPYFPVPFEALPSRIYVHALQPAKTLTIGDFEVTPLSDDSTSRCYGYHVKHSDQSFCTLFAFNDEQIKYINQNPHHLELLKNSDLIFIKGANVHEDPNAAPKPPLLRINEFLRQISEGRKKQILLSPPDSSTSEHELNVREEQIRAQLEILNSNADLKNQTSCSLVYEGQLITL